LLLAAQAHPHDHRHATQDKRDAEGLRRTGPFAEPNEREQDRENLAQRQQNDDAVRA